MPINCQDSDFDDILDNLLIEFDQCQIENCQEPQAALTVFTSRYCRTYTFKDHKYILKPDCNDKIRLTDCIITNSVYQGQTTDNQVNICLRVIELKSRSDMNPTHIIDKFQNSFDKIINCLSRNPCYHIEKPILMVSKHYKRLSHFGLR